MNLFPFIVSPNFYLASIEHVLFQFSVLIIFVYFNQQKPTQNQNKYN